MYFSTLFCRLSLDYYRYKKYNKRANANKLDHPVLHLDLNAKKYETAADLIAMLNQYLEKWEAIYGNEKKDRSPEEMCIRDRWEAERQRHLRIFWTL